MPIDAAAAEAALANLPPESLGWLAGLRDASIGRALAELHSHPTQDWSLDALAGEVGLSRSAMAERFGMTRVLQDQRALQVSRTVQARRELKMSLEKRP